eukprot:m.4097 g.4097  ORF g.4097 m.4097 type:complete len:412 (+) comp10212_c0_seq1:13-1248(+)
MIAKGDSAVLKTDKGLIRCIRIDDKKVRFGKRTFFLAEAIGKPYGTTFEIKEDVLIAVKTPKIDVLSEGVGEEYESGFDNRSINDDNLSQKLTRDDITLMKSQGAKPNEIIGQLVENSDTFKERTEYSQAKYIKKKQLRYEDYVTVLQPSARLVCDVCFIKNPSKTLSMRIDTLSQILTMSNVCCGSRVLLVENCQGLVTGSVLQRLGGQGKLIQFCHEAVPVRPALDAFGLTCGVLEPLEDFPLAEVGCFDRKEEEEEEEDKESVAAEPKEVATEEVSSSSRKRKAGFDVTERSEKKKIKKERLEMTRQFIKDTQMDSLIIASKFQPWPIVEGLITHLAPSRPFVVYSQYKELLVECFVKLREKGMAVALQLSESLFRHYQVLPQRTRPMMNLKGTGGYLLTGTTCIRTN